MSGPKPYQYPLGPLPDAAVDILEHLPPNIRSVQRRNREGEIYETTQTIFVYRVKYQCCGAEGVLTHLQVRERIRKGLTRCRPCGNAKAVEDRAAGLTPGNIDSPKGIKDPWHDSFKCWPAWDPISVDPIVPAEYY